MLNAQLKIALFIDGANLHATAKALGFDIDYKKLLMVASYPILLFRPATISLSPSGAEFLDWRPTVMLMEGLQRTIAYFEKLLSKEANRVREGRSIVRARTAPRSRM